MKLTGSTQTKGRKPPSSSSGSSGPQLYKLQHILRSQKLMSLIILVKLCTWAIKSFVEERDRGCLPEHSICSLSQRERRRNRRKGPRRVEITQREVCLELALGPETEMWDFTLVTGLEESLQQKQPQTDALLTAVCSYQPPRPILSHPPFSSHPSAFWWDVLTSPQLSLITVFSPSILAQNHSSIFLQHRHADTSKVRYLWKRAPLKCLSLVTHMEPSGNKH